MNSDEIQSLVTKVVLTVLTSLSTKYAIDGNLAVAVATGAGALAAIAFGVWQHWNKTKVPEKSMVTVPGATQAVIATTIPK